MKIFKKILLNLKILKNVKLRWEKKNFWKEEETKPKTPDPLFIPYLSAEATKRLIETDKNV